MIVRPRLHWLRMLFVWRGSILKRILPQLFFFLILSCLVAAARQERWPLPLQLGTGPLSLLGVTLAIFLGFRNSTSYERFWEARKLWGSLVIVSRSLSRQLLTLPEPALDPEERRVFSRLLALFAATLNEQLRGAEVSTPRPSELVSSGPALPFEAELPTTTFRPARVMIELARFVRELRRSGRLDPVLTLAIDQNIDRLSEVLGGCERISSTPIPYVYSVLLHRTVYIYSVLLPFALVDTLGWSTPVVSVFVSYTFIALDSVTAELEDPFGVEPNDLPLDALTRTIERAVLELGGAPLPPPALPDGKYRLR